MRKEKIIIYPGVYSCVEGEYIMIVELGETERGKAVKATGTNLADEEITKIVHLENDPMMGHFANIIKNSEYLGKL